ncbi:restriction endonuclease subunit S [Protofrankia symbiont of Coriaria ruscifolia]|uniref:restriction endonuclease subunit S n=1 Tax=Protofrankia symbiont of Coriaria ruscifolia TaxID=1306542 RepID=UPI001041B63F|nr:restriction endonuclease subunit S [Protofrankia symbiont of Coriaria ruscifolia]
MTDLPPGWVRTTLGEIAETSLGKMLDRGKSSGKHLVPYLRNINVQWGSISLHDVLTMDITPEDQEFFRLRTGDLLICEGGEIGRCAIWHDTSEYMAFQKALHRVRPYGQIDSRFLYYLFEHLQSGDTLSRLATGSTIKHLPQQQLRRIPVPLPPLAEQHRVVTALDEYLTRLGVADRLIQSAVRRSEALRRRLAESVSSGGLDIATDRMAFPPPPVEAIDGDLPAIPSSWRWFRLGDIADVVGGVTKDSKKQSDGSLPEVPYLRVANVQRGRLDLRNISRIRVPENTVTKLSLQPGDVLLNEGGDRDKLGRGWVWEGQIPGCIHQNHVFRARIRDGVLDPKLLAWHANGFGQGWCERNGKQSVNLASISLSKIKMMPVPVPPADIQALIVQEIDGYLTDLEHGEAQVRRALGSASHLRRAVLAEAFAGRLVEQDPGDEPASVLLERIQAERAAAGASVPRGRGQARKPTSEDVLL